MGVPQSIEVSLEETILASKSITNLNKTLLWTTIIYYVLIFIFALLFLLRKIRKKISIL